MRRRNIASITVMLIMVLMSAFVFQATAQAIGRGSNHTMASHKHHPKAKATADTVYITPKGHKYHLAGCRTIKKSSSPISRSEAIKKGYKPCKVCNPG